MNKSLANHDGLARGRLVLFDLVFAVHVKLKQELMLHNLLVKQLENGEH